MNVLLAAGGIALASCLFATWCARTGISRLRPGSAWSRYRCATASLAGGGVSLWFAILVLGSGPSICVESAKAAAVLAICPFLSTAAYIDFESSWAPSELIAPICAFAGMVILPPDRSADFTAWASPIIVGSLLLGAAHLAWCLQCAAGRPAIPPADCIALALPAGLFGMHGVAAGVFAIMALSLLAICTVPAALNAFRSRIVHDGISSGRKYLRMADRVPFLSLSFPTLLLGLIASAAFGSPPADACI